LAPRLSCAAVLEDTADRKRQLHAGSGILSRAASASGIGALQAPVLGLALEDEQVGVPAAAKGFGFALRGLSIADVGPVVGLRI